MASVQKELREIEDAARERGFEFRESNGHKKVYFKDQPVMMGDPEDRSTWKPVTVPSTPSDPRWRDNLVATLIRAKVLERDPKDEGQQGLSDDDLERREAERQQREGRQAEAEVERQTQAEEARERARLTAEFQERAASVLGRLGVWQKGSRGGGGHRPRRSVSEAGRLMFAWAERTDFQPRPSSAGAAEQAMKRLYEGGSGLADETRQFVGGFLTLLEESADPVALYFDMLREELGLFENGEDEADEPAAAAQGDGDQPGPEPLSAEAEDDPRVRDLRERLKERDAELIVADGALKAADGALAEARREAEELREELRAAEGATNGNVPELAFECLVEMLGQHVTVAGEDGSADLASVVEMMETKKERALALSKRVAALEVGA